MITGRFAPSPTGPLHFGSLIAALGSYLNSKHQQGRWLLRFDDLDTPRVVPNADTYILSALEHFGLHWDDTPYYQSQQSHLYAAALDTLLRSDHCYPCACSRQQVGSGPYPGTCREGVPAGRTARSIRLRAPQCTTIKFQDTRYGLQQENVAEVVGDFVIRRADRIIAYHLATVVDDAQMQVTEVVRGADLLASTARQILIQRYLHLPEIRYTHLPIALDADGKKLGKSTGSIALPDQLSNLQRVALLIKAMEFLGLRPPSGLLTDSSVEECVKWGVINWAVSTADPKRDRSYVNYGN